MPNGENKNPVIEETYRLLGLKSSGVKYEDFEESLKRPEVMQEAYNILSLESEGVSIGDFSESRGLGKQEEVSSKGSEATSATYIEPSQPSQETEYFIPQDSVAVESGYVDPSADLNPEVEGGEGAGTLYNLLEGVEVTAPEQVDDTTVGSRLYNSLISSVSSFNEGLSATPELIYSLSSSIVNIP